MLLSNNVDFYFREAPADIRIQRAQLQAKHKNTLNWTAKCSVTKTISCHGNQLETVSNNAQPRSHLGKKQNPFISGPLTAAT